MSTVSVSRWAAALVVSVSLWCFVHRVSGETLLGIYDYPQPTYDQSLSNVESVETFQRHPFAVIAFYTEWCQALKPKPWLDDIVFRQKLPSIWDHGAVPLVTWQPACWDPDSPSGDSFVVDIAMGRYDDFVKRWARNLKGFLDGPDGVAGTSDDRRVYIRLGHEMNTALYPWCPNRNPSVTPRDYIAMWRRTRLLFAGEGLTQPTQIQWIWSPNNFEAGGDRGRAELMYPGDDMVDWLGLDVYQGGDLWGVPWAPSASNIMDPMLTRLTRLSSTKPIAIPEFGAHLQQPQGVVGKAAFLKDFMERSVRGGRVKMVVLFNQATFAVKGYGQEVGEWVGLWGGGLVYGGRMGRRVSDAAFLGY
ncbi:glycoside hydrolase superfamily [Chytridium lagenaria]|nr:glycoside hydrolase superfamily [Chytridium lagenaria]